MKLGKRKKGDGIVANTVQPHHNAPLKLYQRNVLYSPFHLSLPLEHLGQSTFCVNQVTFYSILELKQRSNCQVFLKSIQQ